jgi:hypothetical protein
MVMSLAEVATTSFRTTLAADQRCGELLRRLGYKANYLPARLAIARSLALAEPPRPVNEDGEEALGRTIRGQHLFGEGADAAAWLALLVQRAGRAGIERRELQMLVAAHWHRGADLLIRDWEEAEGKLARFVERLAELAALPHERVGLVTTERVDEALAADVVVPVGEIGEDANDTGAPVAFPLNAPGGSPHVAIMGGAGSGKTRTAAEMIRRIRRIGALPLLAFDFKGDLADTYGLEEAFEARVIKPPRGAVPLDVLFVPEGDDTAAKEAAGRIRESIARVKATKLGGIQADALREAVLRVLKTKRPASLLDVGRALEVEYQNRDRKPDELTAALNELNQFTLFVPERPPEEFFKRSWIISLPAETSMELRRLVINLTLDALDRWLNSLPEAPLQEGRRALRHVCLLDEAHVILATKLPALQSLVRMSRSKGGVVVLVSQSPNDFENEDDDFLDNVGLTLAFNTNARPGPTARIFGKGAQLTNLGVGEALCRIRTEARTRRVVAWRP